MAEIALATASSVWKVFKVVRAIREAVSTDRRNHKEYRDIVRSVDRVGSMLKYLQGARELAVHPVMTPVLDDLAGSLDEALKLIQRCQGRNTIHRLFVAQDTAKALSRVKDDIEHQLLMGIFAGMMQILTLTNTIQQPHQVSLIFISVDLDCCRCYRKTEVTLFKLRENEMMTQAKIKFDTANCKVIIAGQFDPNRLSRMIGWKLRKIVKQIEIMEEEKEEEEPDSVEGIRELALGPQSPPHDEGIHVSSAQDKRPATTEEDGCHNSKASEGPRGQPAAQEHPALLEGRESTPQRPFSLQVQVPRGRTPGHGTRWPAAESHVLPHDTNPAMIQGTPKVTKCPCPRSKGVVQVRPPWR